MQKPNANSQRFLNRLFPFGRLQETVLRFPLSSICALVTFLLAIGAMHGLIKESDHIVQLFILLGCGYLWFGILKLFAESRNIKPPVEYLVGLVVFVMFGVFLFLSVHFLMALQFLIPALLLLITVAPFTRNSDNISVWAFNYSIWFGVGMSFAAAFLLWAGLSTALASINYLFGVGIDSKFYADLWAFSALIVAPLYALSWVPQRFVFSEEECRAPVQINFMVNWLLAPLVWLYMLILYAYLVKIAITMEVPRGQLAYMISGFGGVGVVTYLAGWPLRDTGSPLLQAIFKYFFLILIIPIGMMLFAVAERIHAYGVTEQRYMLVLTVVWFAGLSGLFIARKLSLKTIPALLAALLLLASFGPWSGMSVSRWSQTARLENLLVKYEILKDGKIQKSPHEIPFEDRQNISSMVDYLKSRKIEKLQKWFPKTAHNQYASSEDMTKEMGFEYVGSYRAAGSDEYFNFYVTPRNDVVSIAGFDVLSLDVGLYLQDQKWTQRIKADEENGIPEIRMDVADGTLTIVVGQKEPLHFDLAAFVTQSVDKYRGTQPAHLTLNSENADLKARLDIQSLSGLIKDKPELQNMQFNLYLDLKDR